MSQQGTRAIRVAVADDHAILRCGIKLLIESQTDLAMAGEAGSAEELLSILSTTRPDIVLLDISMPAGSGLKVISRIRANFPGTRVIVLTMHTHTAYVRSALAAGASGFLLQTGRRYRTTIGYPGGRKRWRFCRPTVGWPRTGQRYRVPSRAHQSEGIYSVTANGRY